MSTALNDRDAILQAASVRVINPKNASILMAASTSLFHLNAAGDVDVPAITVTATLIGLEGDVTFTVDGAALTSVTGKTAVVRYEDMQGPAAIVTARIVAGGQTFAQSCIIGVVRDGATGGSASVLTLTPSEQVFKISKSGANTPGSITLTAVGQNLDGAPSFTIPAGTATLTAGANSLQKILTFANMATDSVTVQVTQNGVSDRVTIIKVREGVDGIDAITVLLSNESHTIPANADGTPSSVAGALTYMQVYRGIVEDTGYWTFSASPGSNGATGLSYVWDNFNTLRITGMAAAIDAAYVDITASKAGMPSITKRFTVAKSRAGQKGDSITGVRGAGQYYAGGSAWSDGVADAATPGGNVVSDVVTISNGGTYAMTKRWDGAAWNAIGAVFDGSLFVTGSINGAAIKAGTLDIRAPDGSIILKASSSLAQQTMSTPNLAARLSSWTFQGSAGASSGSAESSFINGEYMVLSPAASAGYVGAQSNPLNIPRNSWYTVSFDAYCTGVSTKLFADIYGGGADSIGLGVNLTNVNTRYKFTERSADFAGSPQAYLRMFNDAGGSAIVISNVKVAMGVLDTPWNDSVITPGNAASFVMPDSINNTMIGGDLFSTNWNNIVGPGGAGWLMQRSGKLYASDVNLRGEINGGSFTGYSWPAANLVGYHLGPLGFMVGNANGPGGYFKVDLATGNIYAPGLKVENRQVTLDSPIIIAPQGPNFDTFSVNFSSVSGGGSGKRINLGSRTASIVGGVAPYTYSWTYIADENSAGNIIIANRTTATASFTSSVAETPGVVLGTIELIVIDSKGRTASRTISATCNHV